MQLRRYKIECAYAAEIVIAYVSQMGLDDLRLLMLGGLLLGLVELFDKRHWLTGKSTVELSASTGREKREKLNGLHGKEGIEVHPAEGELLKGTTLASSGNCRFRHDCKWCCELAICERSRAGNWLISFSCEEGGWLVWIV